MHMFTVILYTNTNQYHLLIHWYSTFDYITCSNLSLPFRPIRNVQGTRRGSSWIT